VCSSAGRLFDGFGALLGLGRRNAFEGQMPLAVEIAAMQASPAPADELPFRVAPGLDGADWEIDWRPAVERRARRPAPGRRRAGGRVSPRPRRALVEVACHAGVKTVALSGGCFQNALLRSLAETARRERRLQVLAPRTLPPNDGAIAAGQALGALWHLTDVEMP
jgi:hydrogenase maturation protein HypF